MISNNLKMKDMNKDRWKKLMPCTELGEGEMEDPLG